MQCPKCSSENPEGAKFCGRCGARLARICARCGAELPPDVEARFCFECGAAIEAASAPPAAPPAAVADRLLRQVPKEYAERLLATRGQPHDERRTVTILFSDIKGSTAMISQLDPEDAKEVVQGAFEFLIPPIYRYEGTLVQLMGDAILAFFGAPIAHEDDPERACRAALDITTGAQRYAEKLKAERGIEGFNVRVGINTGLVVVGEVGSDLRVAYTAIGDAINLAARMEQNAPSGGILITHDTYRHIRGVFDVAPQPPLVVKGKAEPVQAYLLQRAKPRAFRLETRGVEGVETRTIGREGELQALKDAYLDAVESGETRVAIVSGDAGVGKSRLLYDLLNWAELRPERFYLFKARSRAETRATPYAVLRDLFINRFEILETDGAATALHKFRAGMAGFLEPERADLVGHWVGFDFSSSEAVSNLLGSASFAPLAMAYLLQYLRAMTAQQPVVVALEDLHWADDSSLDVVDHIVTQMPKHRLFFVCLTRPVLFERRPHWGEGREAYVLLPLRALSRRQSRALVAEILKRAEDIPDEMSDLVVDAAEGNPLYVEELVKMLLEESVIVRDDGSWRVDVSRLQGLCVPPTLSGVLQARLDTLPLEAREVLQRASVVGRIFWDQAVAALEPEGAPPVTGPQLRPLLDEVRKRELIFRREHSSFCGADEYIFKHVLLHEVTYETVLQKLRRIYHQQVAQWLEVNAHERAEEYAGLIAEHYERAGEGAIAAHWLQRVADVSLRTGTAREAVAAAGRALALLPESEKATRAGLLVATGRAHTLLGSYEAARQSLNAGLTLAKEAGDGKVAAAATNDLADLANREGDFAEMRTLASAALELARAEGDRKQEAVALEWLAVTYYGTGYDMELGQNYLEQSLALGRELGDLNHVAHCLNALGEIPRAQGNYGAAARYYRESLQIRAETGDRRGTAVNLFNLGEIAAAQNDHAAALRYHRQAFDIVEEIDLGQLGGYCLAALSFSASATGDLEAASSYSRRALTRATDGGALPEALYVLVSFAALKARSGQFTSAAEWLGLAMVHPARDNDVQQRAESLLAELRLALPARELEAALERGAKLELDEVVEEILGEAQDAKRKA